MWSGFEGAGCGLAVCESLCVGGARLAKLENYAEFYSAAGVAEPRVLGLIRA